MLIQYIDFQNIFRMSLDPDEEVSCMPTSGMPTSGMPTSGMPTSGMPTSGTEKRIRLNVGGVIFETYQLTLIGSLYFKSMFGSFNTDGEIFIDRDPNIFRHVLAYLRDPQYQYPKIFASELDWFGIDPPPHIIKNLHTDHPIQIERIDDGSFRQIILKEPPAKYIVSRGDQDKDNLTKKGKGSSYIVQDLEWVHCLVERNAHEFNDYDVQIDGSDAKIIVGQFGDCLGDMVIRINTANLDMTRYDMFDSIKLSMCGVDIETIDVPLLKMLEMMYLTEKEKKYNIMMAMRGTHVYTLPFYWIRMKCTQQIVSMRNIIVRVVGLKKENIMDIKFGTNIYYLTNRERMELCSKPICMYGWNSKRYDITTTDATTHRFEVEELSERIKNIAIVTEPMIRIKQLTIIVNHITIFKMSGFMIRQRMASKYSIDCDLDEWIYYLEFGDRDRFACPGNIVFLEVEFEKSMLEKSTFEKSAYVAKHIDVYYEKIYFAQSGLIR
jgi:hypothetical protein